MRFKLWLRWRRAETSDASRVAPVPYDDGLVLLARLLEINDPVKVEGAAPRRAADDFERADASES